MTSVCVGGAVTDLETVAAMAKWGCSIGKARSWDSHVNLCNDAVSCFGDATSAEED